MLVYHGVWPYAASLVVHREVRLSGDLLHPNYYANPSRGLPTQAMSLRPLPGLQDLRFANLQVQYTGAPQSVEVDHLGHARACKVLLDDTKLRRHTLGVEELDGWRSYQMRELTPDRALRRNQLCLERPLDDSSTAVKYRL